MHSRQQRQSPLYSGLGNMFSLLDLMLSPIGEARGVSEHTHQALSVLAPELLAVCMNREDHIYVRQEVSAGRGRIDLLYYFYGSSEFDIVEFKAPKNPIVGARSHVTKAFWEALAQALSYRAAIMEGRNDIAPGVTTHLTPPILIIGSAHNRSMSNDELFSIVENDVRTCSKYAHLTDELRKETLAVTTMDILSQSRPAQFASDCATGERPLREDAVSKRYTRQINGVARILLGEGVAKENDPKSANPAKLSFRGRLEEFIRKVAPSLTKTLLGSDCGSNALQDVIRRTGEVLDTLDEFQLVAPTPKVVAPVPKVVAPIAPMSEMRGQFALPERSENDPVRCANALLQIADILLYQQDGDMPCGSWEHEGTYWLNALLGGYPALQERVMPQVRRILSLDISYDLVGRLSHVARYLPSKVVQGWLDDVPFERRWTFPGADELLNGKEHRPQFLALLHMGYCLALHGIEEAVAFMNQCGEEVRVTRDLAPWNLEHAMHNLGTFFQRMKEKAESDEPRLKAFRPWHKGILHSTEKMCKRYERKGLVEKFTL